MPIEFLYLIVVFAVAIVFFTVLKRPLHESMLASFIVLMCVTGKWASLGEYLWKAITAPSLYVIIVFVVSASLLSKTSVIDDCVALILSIFGRLRGGAGLVAIIGSTYMGSLSGSGPGNVATTGVFTIPAMKKSKFPPHLAANVEAHASTMGNMIPPAGMIAIAFAALDTLFPGEYSYSQYWIVLWVIAIWFIVQRIVTLYLMCRYYKVEPMDKADIPSFKQTLKRGWKAVFLPIIVFVPFLLTSVFDTFFESRLNFVEAGVLIDGAKAFNDSIILIIPALIVVCGILLSDKESRKRMTPKFMLESAKKGMKSVVPTSALVMFAYFVSNALSDTNINGAVKEIFDSLNMPLWALALILPLFMAILGMLLPGSAQVKIFGGIVITIIAGAGGSPILAAAMLPCICGAMHGVTPPYCACVYTAMGIAESETKPTLLNCAVWITVHYALSFMMILFGEYLLFGLV
ncbi:MAG: TRAP transporter large permease subunit [Clostridia bacterium]|nr:TRAP transporter large permease subunit [Clostridia bacterium]